MRHFLRLPCWLLFGLFPGLLSAQDLSKLSEQDAFGLNGNVSSSVIGNTMSGMEQRSAPFSWNINGSAIASVYGIEAPFSFMISEADRSYQQPFNEFGISPSYKWVTLHAGYRSVSWSRYTNAGIRFLGADVEAKPGDVQFGAMYGRLQRAVEEDSANRYAIASYRRTGWGAHLAVGNEEGNMRASFFMATDDTTSLRRPPGGILPMQNATLAVGALFRFFDGVALDLDIGSSLLTRDLFSPALAGGGMSGRKQERRVEKFKDFFTLRTSSSLSFAGRASLTTAFARGGARLTCEIIEPEYTSLGAYYFQSDVMNVTVSPNWIFLEGSLRTSGSIGMQRDNVDGEKASTTTRWIGSAMVNWDARPEFGIGAQYSNFTAGQAGARMPVNDSIRVRNINQSISLNPRLLLSSGDVRHVFTGVASYMTFQDLNAFTRAFTDVTTTTAMLSYNVVLPGFPQSVMASLSQVSTRNAQGTMRIGGLSVGASATFVENTVQAAASLAYSRVASDVYGASQVLSESLSLSYAPSEADRFALSGNANQNSGGTTANPQFRERSVMLSYQRGFNWNPFAASSATTQP